MENNDERLNDGREFPPPISTSRPNSSENAARPPVTPRRGYSFGTKIFFISLIALGLLIPDLLMISLIDDREQAQNDVVSEISSSWSGEQLISGPIVTIPYDSISPDNKGGKIRLLPDSLLFEADVKSQTLYRGIYESVVYGADVTMSGLINVSSIDAVGVPVSACRFDEASVTVGIGDLKGVEAVSNLRLGDRDYVLEGGRNLDVYAFSGSMDSKCPTSAFGESSVNSGCLVTPVKINMDESAGLTYSLNMSLKGSRSIGVTPVGRYNNLVISGDCESPSFTGMFLPSKRDVGDGTFTALWRLNSINRDYPQAFIGDRALAITQSAAIVDMLVPVDRYQKADRAVKYAIIVILLTFIAVLFAEVMMKHPISLFQYLLIGLALVLFYSLLLSLAEHLGFGYSYLLASVLTIGMIVMYMKGVLKSDVTALAIGALLSVIYIFIYVLLCLESYSLLVGSFGLFIALALIMYVTLKLRIEDKA